MRKPISKHGLRRALERVHAEGHIEYQAPVGTVVDKIWHELEKGSYKAGKKKPITRESVRTAGEIVAELDPNV
jgi:DNA-binding FadR family transcriptional regulator